MQWQLSTQTCRQPPSAGLRSIADSPLGCNQSLMRGANIFTGVVIAAWVGLALLGLSLVQGVAGQNVPGYPSSGQIQFLVVNPALVATALVVVAWLCNRFARYPALLGCLSGAAFFAVFIYVSGFGGGV